MKKITLFAALLFAASSLFAQTAGDMFISGSLGLAGGTDGSNYEYLYEGDIEEGYRQVDVKDFSFSITPEFGYFVADNMLLKLGLSYNINRSLAYQESREGVENPNNSLYRPSGKYWYDEKKEYVNTYSANFYDYTHLFSIRPAFHYYLTITENFYYTPGVSLDLGFGCLNSEKWQDYEENDWSDYEEYQEKRGKEIDKESSRSVFQFGLNLHLVAFEFRPTQNFAINLSAGEFGYVYSSVYRNLSEKEYEEIYDVENVKTKSNSFDNDVRFNLNLGAKIGFSYYF
ncbi:MAG: hypothetical protein IJY67_07960 [Paludibacteraceae bacterium]|nr:hypothetical protein [Paludibacteraceae bacterium]